MAKVVQFLPRPDPVFAAIEQHKAAEIIRLPVRQRRPLPRRSGSRIARAEDRPALPPIGAS